MKGPRKRKPRIDWIRYSSLIQYVAFALCLVTLIDTAVATLCDLNSGSNTIQDQRGDPHSVNISVTRDGSIWLRIGKELQTYEWRYKQEPMHAYDGIVLSKKEVELLRHLNYSDTCVLSDLKFEIRMDASWHPSFVYVYDTTIKEDQLFRFTHYKDCHLNTTLQLSPSKQNLGCYGGERNVCGSWNLPLKGTTSGAVFIKRVIMAPNGENSNGCFQQPVARKSFTFTGSYYHAYVKLASCPPIKDSRDFGQEPKMRTHFDPDNSNKVLIPDPTRTALTQGTIIGWRVFIQQISMQHQVYFQVWRPSEYQKDRYFLVGQTRFTPKELQFQEVPLKRSDFLSLSKDDVLGLHFPHSNPIAYTPIPCASTKQRHIFLSNPQQFKEGDTLSFTRAPPGENACRQYSFTAILANKSSAKLIDDWECPSQQQSSDTQKRNSELLDSTRNKNERTKSPPPPDINGDMAVSVNYILLIIGGLLLLMITIGSFSYYRAIKS